ncbi:MAG: hypothetical protein R3C03_02250 [Pirellulaceae bacterium]
MPGRFILCTLLIFALSCGLISGHVTWAQEPAKDKVQEEPTEINRVTSDNFANFMRVHYDANRRPTQLETSITRYEVVDENGEKISVDLIGVVHVGEQEYYEALNEQFKGYDATLYELVAPEGTRIPKGGRSEEEEAGFNPIAGLQLGMKSMLGLEFQLDHIDYMSEKLIHADMSPDEFFESMKNNEESFGRIFMNSIAQSMADPLRGQEAQADMILSLFSKNKTKRLRRMMAKQMLDMEGGMAIFNGKDGSTIIDHRNAKVMEILKRELANGHKSLAIFYGAGHLADMERRLMSDFQMKRSGRTWLTAWDLTGKSTEK